MKVERKQSRSYNGLNGRRMSRYIQVTGSCREREGPGGGGGGFKTFLFESVGCGRVIDVRPVKSETG